ncbi:hypothetical protein [Pseudofrankia inefficax]|uniref:Uncharacterized protein n=1 Tax=Pseudofrankia inefficax (strain DSM 45817 / CECT 9037 / DDB 130130 / EuI1c) TaxID=298654 RepID=E3J3L8_PSEI1|nr:hypothetical protein [Pseudofrankia inefficax]ADP79355.1 hypothetical protein FraEuI1c_1283 [Pseudofrankia inefficax]
MGMPAVSVSLGDGLEALFVPALPLNLPATTAGLLLGRPVAVEQTRPGLEMARRSAAVVASGFEFVEIHAGELTRVAVSMGRSSSVASVVICPPGVSPARTALAVAVAGVLRGHRGDGHAVVTCAVCPPLGVGRSAIPHEVAVRVGDRVEIRHVWEIVSWPQIPIWLATLSPRPIAA